MRVDSHSSKSVIFVYETSIILFIRIIDPGECVDYTVHLYPFRLGEASLSNLYAIEQNVQIVKAKPVDVVIVRASDV
jgi:hypothetical protein